MAAPENTQHVRKRNAKRKKSFLANARGMGKKGKFGHGEQMDQDTYNYFIRVLELLREDFDSPQDKESLVLNALAQTEDEEVKLSSNQVGCRVIEQLVRLAPPSALVRYMNVFLPNLRVVATNRFASHVLQGLLSAVTKFGLECPKIASKNADSSEEPEQVLSSEEALNWVLKVAKFILNNVEEFVWEEYANFVIRTVLQCLSGSPPSSTDSHWSADQKKAGASPGVVQSQNDEEQVEVVLPDGFRDVLKDYYERISSNVQFPDMAYSSHTSALLQTLLSVLSKTRPKLKNKLIRKLIEQSFCARNTESEEKKDPDQKPLIPVVFSADASMRLLETALEHGKPKHVTQMYAMYFLGHLIDLATDRAANFCVQRLLAYISDKSEFESIFDELAPGLQRVIAGGKSGVVLALCQACERHSTKQGQFIEHLMKALNCYDPAERRTMITPLCMRLCTYEDFKAQQDASTPQSSGKDGVLKSKFNLHGSLIVQTLLRFKKPIKIVNSLLEMPGAELKTLMCDTKGSHIMDAFVKSEFVGEKSRLRLAYKLVGSYVAMACSKHGSRALEVLLEVSELKMRTKIMEELASRKALIIETPSGSIVASKWNLDVFCRDRNGWAQSLSRKERTKELFADIISSKEKSKKS